MRTSDFTIVSFQFAIFKVCKKNEYFDKREILNAPWHKICEIFKFSWYVFSPVLKQMM